MVLDELHTMKNKEMVCCCGENRQLSTRVLLCNIVDSLKFSKLSRVPYQGGVAFIFQPPCEKS